MKTESFKIKHSVTVILLTTRLV